MSLVLSVENSHGSVLSSSLPGDETWLVHEGEYSEGDQLVLSSSPDEHVVPRHIFLRLDDALSPMLVYMTGGVFRYPVPFGEKKVCFNPLSFSGTRHYIYVRYATPGEIGLRRNLACNPFDFHANTSLFPHARANVETRGESVFAARNAIDGLKANSFHGEWPYTSWGINRDPAACLTVEFGRPVHVDAAVFTLRADFPHDAWWQSATLGFSDGSSVIAKLRKDSRSQVIEFPARVTEWVTLDTLVKADDPSPFPALTQLEIWGVEHA